MTIPYTFSSGINTSFSTQLNSNFSALNTAIPGVIASRLTSTSTTSSSLVAIDTITFDKHDGNTAYRLIAEFINDAADANVYLSVRFTDGSTTTDSGSWDVGNNSNATSCVILDIIPISSTQVKLIGRAHGEASVPAASSYKVESVTMASSGTWANQDSLTIRIARGSTNSGTLVAYSLQRISTAV